jgi:glutamyl-tRNA reductase
VGEVQILGQVKQAYELAQTENSVGAITNSAFQSALRVAKRVATETTIQQRRVSIPSVAVADFAKQFFERFDDKQVLVIGAGDMAEETVRYLLDEGARHVTLVNRNLDRAQALADKIGGMVKPWDHMHDLLVTADLVVSTTGAMQPIITTATFREIDQRRYQRPLFILDLAVPRDFEPAIGEFNGVYLCSVDDLRAACERNRKEREKEWPRAERIIEEETARFMTDLHHRATGPTIKRLKNLADNMKQEELVRLLNKLGPAFDEKTRTEIERSFDRLINKLLHPPLESLRDEAARGQPHGLLSALKQLFRLSD